MDLPVPATLTQGQSQTPKSRMQSKENLPNAIFKPARETHPPQEGHMFLRPDYIQSEPANFMEQGPS